MASLYTQCNSIEERQIEMFHHAHGSSLKSKTVYGSYFEFEEAGIFQCPGVQLYAVEIGGLTTNSPKACVTVAILQYVIAIGSKPHLM